MLQLYKIDYYWQFTVTNFIILINIIKTTLLKYLFNISLFWNETVFYSVTVSNEQDTRNRSMSNAMGRFKIQSETIKYSNSKLKRDVTSVEWIQCNPFSFLTDLSDMKLLYSHRRYAMCILHDLYPRSRWFF